jgi:hypothetical protein
MDGLDEVPLAIPPDDLPQYAGTYRFAEPDDEDVDVRVNGHCLTVEGRGDAAFYTSDRIVALEGLWRHERGQFMRGRDGQITFLRMGGGLGRRLS